MQHRNTNGPQAGGRIDLDPQMMRFLSKLEAAGGELAVGWVENRFPFCPEDCLERAIRSRYVRYIEQDCWVWGYALTTLGRRSMGQNIPPSALERMRDVLARYCSGWSLPTRR